MRKKLPKKEVNMNEWLNTYSDTITLLLCFFVLLFSFSTINESKWKAIVESFGLQNINASASGVEISSNLEDISVPESSPQDELFTTIQDYIDNHNLSSRVELLMGDKTITLRFRDTVLFDPDSAELRADGKEILSSMCGILRNSIDLIEMIQIEGHTAANIQGYPQFKNTFSFSSQRAVNVLMYAINEQGIDPYKACAVGYGQYHPIGDNQTVEGREMNRRVEIVITSCENENTEIVSDSKNTQTPVETETP